MLRQASSDGSWVDVGRYSNVSSRSRKEMEMEVEVAAIDVGFACILLPELVGRRIRKMERVPCLLFFLSPT